MVTAAQAGRFGVLAISLGAALALGSPATGVARADTSTIGAAGSDTGPTAGRPRPAGTPRPAPRSQAPARRNARPGPEPATRAAAALRRVAAQQVSDTPSAATATGVATAPRAAAGGVNPIAALINNTSPTVNAAQTGQSAGGVVTGTITVVDPDSPGVGVAVTRAPAHGTVSIVGGQYTYTADPVAAQAGYTDTFAVTVDDSGSGFHIHGLAGLINLMTFGLLGQSGHAATRPVTVNVAATAPTTGLSTFCGCTLMPADTVFHADVSRLPVLPRSETWTQLVGGTLRAAWGGEVWMNNTAGMPVNTVGASRPTETVIFNRGLVTSGPSIDDRPYAIPDRPIVEGMPNVPAWDRHLLVFREGSCTSQELYNVANGVELPANSPLDALGNTTYAALYGSAWIAEAGVQVDMNSPLYPAAGWANASRLPYLPLILRPDDLARGSIDHMLGFAIAKDRGTGYTWPARAGDGTGTNPDGVPMGTVFRLSPDFDISGFSPATQVVLRALQQHGAVVFDSIGAGQDGATLLAMSNGWTGTDYLTAQRELRTVPLSAFEAVDVLSLAADTATGWTIRV